jgi:predicted nucleic acid-binding Zn ribbon protein
MKERYSLYIQKNQFKGDKLCVECGEKIPHWKSKYCSDACQRLKYSNRYQHSAVKAIYKGQCTENINTSHGIQKCGNQGLEHREGMCEECYIWNLRRHNIYPHKDNATRCTELYLVL